MKHRTAAPGLILMTALFAGCIVAPEQPAPAPAPAPPVVYPTQPPPPDYRYQQIQQCRSDNARAHQEVHAMYDDARRRGRITPGESQRFAEMEARLTAFRRDLARDGITLQDCQRIGAAIARERDEVIRMTRSDPGVRRCMSDNWRARDDIYRIYNDARYAGRIDVNEAQRFKAMETRLQNYYNDLARDGLTMDDCYRIANLISRDRAVVEGMARY